MVMIILKNIKKNKKSSLNNIKLNKFDPSLKFKQKNMFALHW